MIGFKLAWARLPSGFVGIFLGGNEEGVYWVSL
jgi:hypothetical protein